VEISRQDHPTVLDYRLRKSYPDSNGVLARADKDIKDALSVFARSKGCDSAYLFNVSKRIDRVQIQNNGSRVVQNLIDEKSSGSPADLCRLFAQENPGMASVADPKKQDVSKISWIDAIVTIEACDVARKCTMISNEKISDYDVAHITDESARGAVQPPGDPADQLKNYVESFADSKECFSYTAGKAEVKVHRNIIRVFPAGTGKPAQTLSDETTFSKPKDFCTGITQYPAIEAKLVIEACDAAKNCEVVGSNKDFGYAVPSGSIPGPDHYQANMLLDVTKARLNARNFISVFAASKDCHNFVVGKVEVKTNLIISRTLPDGAVQIAANESTSSKAKGFCTTPQKTSKPSSDAMPQIRGPGF